MGWCLSQIYARAETGVEVEKPSVLDRLPTLQLYFEVAKGLGKVSYKHTSIVVQLLVRGRAVKPDVTIKKYINTANENLRETDNGFT